MSDLINFVSKKTMSSREIAEITGKRHDHVIRDVDNLNKSYEKLELPKVGEGYYPHPNTGKKLHRCFDLTKMQTFDLLTGYSTVMRIKVNRRWEELENNEQNLVRIAPKRKHNRLTATRLNDIMRHVCMIENNELRITITNKLYENK